MATLIQPLATGIASCPSGTAEFYRAGTTTPVSVYELDTSTGSYTAVSTPITLDSEGSRVVYARESVDVVVRAAGGTEKRRFRATVHAKALVVESTSFTGTNDAGNQAVGGRVDDNAVLDRWIVSAGAPDWKVRRSGATADQTLVQALSAIESVNSPFFNVTDYGAVGDGTTDDYGPIVAAYNAAVAAGGGIVFFESGTYLMNTAFTCSDHRVSFLGESGRGSVIKTGISSGYSFVVNPAQTAATHQFIRDLGFSSTANGGGIQLVASPGILLDNVYVVNMGANTAATAFTIDIQTKAILRNVMVDNASGPPTAGSFYLNTGSDYSEIINCKSVSAALVQQALVLVIAQNCKIHGGHYEVTSHSAASATRGIINLGTAAGTGNPNNTSIVGVTFKRPASANPCISLNIAAANIYESGNFADAYRTDIGFMAYGSGSTYTGSCQRLSRVGRVTNQVLAGNYTPDTDYEVHYLSYTANFTINAPTGGVNNYFPGSGGRLVFIVQNTGGGGIVITWNAAYNSNVANVGVTQRLRLEMVYEPSTGIWRLLNSTASF